ncbi:hypothetical protein ACEPAF_5903 [Sanghuangporus sanghuang]
MKPLLLSPNSPFHGTLKAIQVLLRMRKSKTSARSSQQISVSSVAGRVPRTFDSGNITSPAPSEFQSSFATKSVDVEVNSRANVVPEKADICSRTTVIPLNEVCLSSYLSNYVLDVGVTQKNEMGDLEDRIPDGGTPEDLDEFARGYHTFTFKPLNIRKPFTQDFDLLDDMFDAILVMKSFKNVKGGPKSEKAAEQAGTNGMRDQAFPLAPPSADHRDGINALSSRNGASSDVEVAKRIEIFPAYLKALQFFYMRFLLHADIYELPMFSLTVEDVARLCACGMINADHLDHVFLISMLGHGLLRRFLREQGLAQIDHTTVPPPGSWTIPVGTRRPTRKEVFNFIADCENFRFRRPYARTGFRTASFERPKLTNEYTIHRIDRDGFFGLKRMAGLSDDDVRILLSFKDPMYIPPEARTDTKRSDIGPAVNEMKEDIATVLGLKNALWEGESDLDDEDIKFYSVVGAPALNTEDSTKTDRGRDAESKGKKRARSRSAESDDSGSRRVRPRLLDQESQPAIPVHTSFRSLSWPVCIPTYDYSPASESVEPSFFPSDTSVFSNGLPVRSVSACKSRKARPPAQSTRDPNILYDPYFDKFFKRPEKGEELRAEDYIINVRPNCEKGPKYALLYDLIIPSWAELCGRWKLLPPYRQLGHGTQPKAQPGPCKPNSSSTVPRHRRHRRYPLKYLHEVFPQFHPYPHISGLHKSSGDARPNLFPPCAPTNGGFERC